MDKREKTKHSHDHLCSDMLEISKHALKEIQEIACCVTFQTVFATGYESRIYSPSLIYSR